MPRSGPGALTGLPSRVIRPVVGWSSPATSRNSVDLPQPEGPRMVTKSLSRISSDVGSSARVGAPPRTPGKTRETRSIASLLKQPLPYQGRHRRPSAAVLHAKHADAKHRLCAGGGGVGCSCKAPGKEPPVSPFEQEVG